MRVQELFDLSGQAAIVTGGGSGLGRQMAEALAELGSNVVVCARKIDRCQQTAAELEKLGVRSLALACDVRNPDDVDALIKATIAEFGQIDVLVNDAGTSWGAPAEETPRDGWQKVIDVNLSGLFFVSQAVARTMFEHGGGAIVNIASASAFHGSRAGEMDAVAYTASKGGVVSLTRDLAWKWAPRGIRVNAIAPGWFPSDMSKMILDRFGEDFAERIPLGRLGGPDDLKGAIAFLASQASAYVTGQVLLVDGGQTA
ncbi:MAG: SDR family oxidoreductase [Acidimicrobiales bacterium]|jgi:NAD(P)-dependent dehydrogenase (short-subunit alcohol dehydrogenase family)